MICSCVFFFFLRYRTTFSQPTTQKVSLQIFPFSFFNHFYLSLYYTHKQNMSKPSTPITKSIVPVLLKTETTTAGDKKVAEATATTTAQTTSTAVQQQQQLPSFATLSVLPQHQQIAQGPRSILTCVWRCNGCQKDCQVIKSENRCICNHRSKEHAMDQGQGKSRCKAAGCKCKDFFYIVAEGAWILRCRCKHKHNEHDPNPPYKCVKPGCKQCTGFDSPFVCNCNCGWAQHQMVWEMRQLRALPQFDDFGDPALVKRGLDDDE